VFFLGLDISTTASKALLIDREGGIVASRSTPLQVSQPRPLWSEQNPNHWWEGTVQSIHSVLESVDPRDVDAVGLTGQMHGLVLLDDAGMVIRPAILWNDQRTEAQCNTIRERIGRKRLIALTGNDALTGFTAPKLLWVQEHEPEPFARVAKVILPKDYIRYRLTAEYATDLAGASGTLLLDVAHRRWSDEMLQALSIPSSWLPPTHEGTEQTSAITGQGSSETGLMNGTPVYAGGGDQAAQAVGVGAVSSEVVALTLGTSGVVFASSDQYTYEPEGRLHAFCHAVPGKWHLMGVMLSAAGSLQWYRDTLAPDTSFDVLIDEAEEAPPGAEGLIFLPYLTGERTPHPNPHARGAFIGLTARHARAHLTRAVLEGVAFGLRDSFRLLQKAEIQPESVVISGGGAQSSFWRQIIADVLNVEILSVNSEEGAAFGAALLSAVGVGEFSSISEACARTIRTTGRMQPRDDVAAYESIYPHYRALYPALVHQFEQLSGLASEN
jgi:xylulokinase